MKGFWGFEIEKIKWSGLYKIINNYHGLIKGKNIIKIKEISLHHSHKTR